MKAEEITQALGNILAKRKAIGKYREELEKANPGHWLVTSFNQSKITAWLKAGEADSILERLEPSERERLLAIATDEPAPAIPARAVPAPAAEEPAPAPAPVVAEEPAPAPVVKPLAPAAEEKPAKAPEKTIPVPAPSDPGNALEAAIRAIAAGAVPAHPAPIDRESIREIVAEEIAKAPARGSVLTIIRKDLPKIEVEGRNHYRFPLVLLALQAEAPTLLVGPAGTGKTTLCRVAAKSLGLAFYPVSFSPLTTKSDLMGFVDAGGTYRESAFVKSFREGGVFCADEFDSARPDVAIIMNAGVANRILTLPTGEVIEASNDWQFIACANTYGTGPDALYTGRNRLDAATLDRFFTLEIPPDEGLEASLAGVVQDSPPLIIDAGGIPEPAEWLATVQACRLALEGAGAQVVISQRATLLGIALASVGIGRDWLFQGLIAKGLKGTALHSIASFR